MSGVIVRTQSGESSDLNAVSRSTKRSLSQSPAKTRPNSFDSTPIISVAAPEDEPPRTERSSPGSTSRAKTPPPPKRNGRRASTKTRSRTNRSGTSSSSSGAGLKSENSRSGSESSSGSSGSSAAVSGGSSSSKKRSSKHKTNNNSSSSSSSVPRRSSNDSGGTRSRSASGARPVSRSQSPNKAESDPQLPSSHLRNSSGLSVSSPRTLKGGSATAASSLASEGSQSPRSNGLSLEDCLESSLKREFLREYMETEYCTEVIDFDLAVRGYRRCHGHEASKVAQNIYVRFIRPGSKEQVNFGSELVAELRRRILAQETSNELFEQCEEDVQKMLRDIFIRFERSPQYELLVLNLERIEHQQEKQRRKSLRSRGPDGDEGKGSLLSAGLGILKRLSNNDDRGTRSRSRSSSPGRGRSATGKR